MAKNNLAGLAALGALGMMMSKGKKTEVEDCFGSGEGTPYSKVENAQDIQNRYEMEDRSNAVSRGRTDLVDTGMSTPEPDENYRNAGPRTEPVGVSSAPKVRSSKPKGPNPALQSNIDPESMRRMVTNMGGYTGIDEARRPYKKGGVVKMAKGGMTSSASSRADGIAQKGKTRGKVC